MNEVKLNTIRALIGEATPKIGRFSPTFWASPRNI